MENERKRGDVNTIKLTEKTKIQTEKRIMKLSLIGSILFMAVEGIMAYVTNSSSILIDFVFDITELIMIWPFLFLVPLLYKPVTEKRPYGFAQIESLFIIIKYSVLLFITIQLFIDSLHTILDGGHAVDAGSIAIFEFCVFIGCFIMYKVLSYYRKKYESDSIRAELYVWKLDVLSSLGVSFAFFAQMILQKTSFSWAAPYIDPVVAIIMSLCLIIEPVRMIGISLKELVLFAPKKEIMDEIRETAQRYIENGMYKLQFLDVIQTGRKTWVEVYIRSHDNNINISELKNIRNEIISELKPVFDQIYVELIPDVEE